MLHQLPTGAEFEAGQRSAALCIDAAKIKLPDAKPGKHWQRTPQQQIVCTQFAPLVIGPTEVIGCRGTVNQKHHRRHGLAPKIGTHGQQRRALAPDGLLPCRDELGRQGPIGTGLTLHAFAIEQPAILRILVATPVHL